MPDGVSESLEQLGRIGCAAATTPDNRNPPLSVREDDIAVDLDLVGSGLF